MTLHLSDREFETSAATESVANTNTNVSAFDLRRAKPSWQSEIVATLCRYVDLPKNWDSYGGMPLRHDTGMFALQVLNGMMGPTIASPHIVPAGDGGVQIEWHQNGFDVELFIAAPYESELTVRDLQAGTSKTFLLTSDFSPLSDALLELTNYNRHIAINAAG